VIEMTINVFVDRGQYIGIGTVGKATRKQTMVANCLFSFVRGDTRLWVLSYTEDVTETVARYFAIALYEGRATRINLCDCKGEFTALRNGGRVTT
jgi:hypothetical protein